MATQASNTLLSDRMSRNSDIMLAVGVISIIMVLVLPLKPLLLDLLLSLSIAISVLILFVSLFTVHPLDFSSFPTVLLISTLYRLALNVASTRLILSNGNEGLSAAGAVIKSFGSFVVGGNYLVGVIIFLILVVINFVVITKGAGRIAEVAARFTLDAMPGKQMAIDADLNAGIINDQDAKRRRARIQQEADFYGAMDGASKFVRGDAIAGLIITAANIVGGLVIGVFQYGMDINSALNTYTVLTVGDGLVSQMPSLIVSIAAGIAVTKASVEEALSLNLKRQLMGNARALLVAATVILVFGLIPGMPTFPMLTVAALIGGLAWVMQRGRALTAAAEAEAALHEAAREAEESPEDIESLLPIDRLGLEMGYGIIPLVDAESDGELLERIKSIRRQIALEVGFIVPPIHIKDNLELQPGNYSIIINGVEVGAGEVMLEHFLAMKTGEVETELKGIETIEPAFGLPALWIAPEDQDRAQLSGYTVVDVPTVISTHLIEVIKRHAPEFLGRQETQRLLDNFAKNEPKVVEELIPGILALGVVQKVLQNLLSERVSIRDLHTILETLADMGAVTKDPELLTEYVRQNMARTITRQYQTPGGTLPLIALSQEVEDQLANSLQSTPQGTYLGLDPESAQQIIHTIEGNIEQFNVNNYQPILLCSPLIRPHVKKLTDRFIPNLVVLSHNEISNDVRIESLGIVG
ncbi:MAG: flagellar biosynthesis protein FlhA [Deltaproteobacteria bacterium]|nr:flagellar biosynthesis protein FlhA [Deltaproteobacteria bacterium]